MLSVAQLVAASADEYPISLNAISVDGMGDGTQSYVTAQTAYYRYDPAGTDAQSLPTIVAPLFGDGRWYLIS